jgi:hypothetical protein
MTEDEEKVFEKEIFGDWQKQARAAGWSPPISSKLRIVEKCPTCQGGGWLTDREHDSRSHNPWPCWNCHGTGTIKRPLIPEEIVEVAEACIRLYRTNKWSDFPLSSGAKVILVEGNDAV